jgi:tetratricopeptide (TPR) repeat protein
MAACLDRLGRAEEAIAEYRKILAVSPGQVKAWVNIALIQERNGNDAEAVESLRRALEIEPENALALYHLAWILSTHPLRQIRNGQQALLFADRFVRVNGEQDPLAMDVLGAALAEAGRYPEAQKAAAQAMALAEKNGLADLAAAIALRQQDYRQHRPFRGRVLPGRNGPGERSPAGETIPVAKHPNGISEGFVEEEAGR